MPISSLPVIAGDLLLEGLAHEPDQVIIRPQLVPGPNSPLLVFAAGLMGIVIPKGVEPLRLPVPVPP